MKIDFYEKVVVVSSERYPSYVGRVGTVLGISEDNKKIHAYSVFFENEDDGIMFSPENLMRTGEKVDRGEFYDIGDSIKVTVVDQNGYIDKS
ncbi:Imm31 family immunity protein [Sphingomonadaceae bacterium jetA1]|jgi:hypothetical protein|uniref:hypothetical protein n=1 Tax=Facivitalis istanbulensis TaxID=3075838 RepID=UPI003485EC37